jgi:hypothetical protein
MRSKLNDMKTTLFESFRHYNTSDCVSKHFLRKTRRKRRRRKMPENPEEKVAKTVVTSALKWFDKAFGWWNYNSGYQDHRGFEGPRKAVSSNKLIHFEYNQWRVFFSAKKAVEMPGDFAENFLIKEFNPDFARRYLEQAEDTTWLKEIKTMYERVMEGLYQEPYGQVVFERWEKIMIDDGNY